MANPLKLIGLALLRMAILSLLTVVIMFSTDFASHAYESGHIASSIMFFFMSVFVSGLVGAILVCSDWLGGRVNGE